MKKIWRRFGRGLAAAGVCLIALDILMILWMGVPALAKRKSYVIK